MAPIRIKKGEICLVFWIFYFLLTKKHTIQVVYPLIVLCLLLMQGSVYWIICLIRMQRYNKRFATIGNLYGFLKYVNIALLFFYLPILAMSPIVACRYYAIGIFLELFAIVEFVNYFLVRLSYKNVTVLFSHLKMKTLNRSSLAKEIEKCNFSKKKKANIFRRVILATVVIAIVVFLFWGNNAIQITNYSFQTNDFPVEFQGEPFLEEEYCQAIDQLQLAIDKYKLETIGYQLDVKNPRIQLEPIGKRGYIELLPVIKK